METRVKPTLLIVDDDENIRTQMKWALVDDHEVLLAEDRESALATVAAERADVVLLDLGLPPHPNDTSEGFRALGELLGHDRFAKIIVITGQSEKENALRAIGEGAYDFLCKPIDTDELQIILKRAFHVSHLEREYHRLQEGATDEGFEGMLGASPQIQEVFAAIRKVATTDVPVLVLGESGTGKEMAAQAVHRRSRRGAGPFVTINCAAIPEPLLESELFGHEKGAFTGAHMQRRGRIEAADGGTLFLDEIGELPPSLQVKLLRFLQEQCIERVGGRTPIQIDTRVIAATNIDIKQAMQQDRFREDLYYRLAVVVLRMPPLRDRQGDIPLLARAFLQRYAPEVNDKVAGFAPKALKALQQYAWPGNVREMDNRVKRAIIMAESRHIAPSDLDIGSAADDYEGLSLREAREELDRNMVSRALDRSGGNMTRAASLLGISRPTLYELMEKLGITKP
jgi:two-component system, NtrC family, response regulator